MELHLFYLLYKLHNLEFRRVFKQMVAVFISQVFFYLFNFYFVEEFEDVNDSKFEYGHYFDVCPGQIDDGEVAEIYIFWIMQVPFIFPCAAIILIKSKKDIL